MKKKLIPVVAVLAVLVAVVSWFYFRNTTDGNHKVFVSGNIEATEVDLSFRIAGQIDSLPIEEGDRIKKGQVIATLDTDTLVAQRGAAESDIANLRALLDELEEGSRIEEIEAARALAKAAESRLKNAKDEYDRYLPLYNQGAISASAFDTKATALKVATEDYNNTTQRLQELEKGPREQQIRAARARLQRAEWDLKRINLDIAHSTLDTPVSGVVLVKSNEVGEVVLPGATVTTVAAVDEVWLKGYIGEDKLGLVKLGQNAHVTTDTYPGKTYTGKVTFIASRAEFTPKNVQTKEERVKQVYRVKITIPNLHQELKIGMPAEGYILTDGEPGKTGGAAKRDRPTS
ncbi:MAG TPA: efflux RND transporter periplasmic adaptor subunit [Desulfomonilaceae bacterium]|nr:efflux RND transporter periplasmic adaptor subunit [Desulfomonilaceae bacterium]